MGFGEVRKSSLRRSVVAVVVVVVVVLGSTLVDRIDCNLKASLTAILQTVEGGSREVLLKTSD